MDDKFRSGSPYVSRKENGLVSNGDRSDEVGNKANGYLKKIGASTGGALLYKPARTSEDIFKVLKGMFREQSILIGKVEAFREAKEYLLKWHPTDMEEELWEDVNEWLSQNISESKKAHAHKDAEIDRLKAEAQRLAP